METKGGWAVSLALAGWAFRTLAKPKTRSWFEGILARARKREPRPVSPLQPDPAGGPPPSPAPDPGARPASPADAPPKPLTVVPDGRGGYIFTN